MDVAEESINQFHMVRRMLGVDQRVEAGGIYKTEVPSALLQNDIIFTCLPIFELEWRTSEWREFLSSIFENPLSKVKLLSALRTPREIGITFLYTMKMLGKASAKHFWLQKEWSY